MIDGKFDPEKFSVVKNAVTLSKLALLDNQGLTELASALGIDPVLVQGVDSLVRDSFANIDGNHQWMETSPPLPRELAYAGIDGKTYANEGEMYSSSDGFPLWGDNIDYNIEGFRDLVFRSIFSGPLSPGIDAPEIFSMPPIVTDEYENLYNPTEALGYPSYTPLPVP